MNRALINSTRNILRLLGSNTVSTSTLRDFHASMSRTAGIIIIGDEVLNGNIVDTNSPFLCKQFHLQGIRVCKISTIPDRVDVIGNEVQLFSESFDIVITTGGVGPTHDDVTYEGVASAFNVSLRKDEQLEKFFEHYLNQNADPFAAKLITIPSSAEVIFATNLENPLYGGFNSFPVIKMRNVFCFPGVPDYLRTIFLSLGRKYFQNENTMYFSRAIYLTVSEIHIVTILNELVTKFKDSVIFGSYPLVGDSQTADALTKISVESPIMTDCLNAEKLLISKIPPYWVAYPKIGFPNFAFIQRLTTMDTELSNVLKTSYQIIEECFNQYTIDETFMCFNGGKDCTVLLNLLCSFCAERKFKQRLKLLYFQEVDAFQEVDEFIDDIKKNYDIDLCTLPMPMKDSLSVFLTRESKRKACFMGLRNTDPKTENLKPIQETDSDWPKVMRVSPILHWTYKNIWDFLRCANIPYCSLYNYGYSSLGSRNNTSPNPALQFMSEDGTVYYRSAFFLEDKFERRSRCSKSNGKFTLRKKRQQGGLNF